MVKLCVGQRNLQLIGGIVISADRRTELKDSFGLQETRHTLARHVGFSSFYFWPSRFTLGSL